MKDPMISHGNMRAISDDATSLRLRLDLSYDGGGFHGWARQPGLRTVQGCLEDALSLITHPAKGLVGDWSPIWNPRLVVAGRTDSGVHASHQVCHLDIPRPILDSCQGHMGSDPVLALKHRLIHLLPADIVLHNLLVAPPGFDARFSALERTYVYRICDHPEKMDPRLRGFVLPLETPLNVEDMNQALTACLGLHDYGSFATPNPGGTTIRKVRYAHWDRVQCQPSRRQSDSHDPALPPEIPLLESGLVYCTITADAFAHNMVRSLVKATVCVGQGKKSISWFKGKIQDPVREGDTGPIEACGLTLEDVRYPPDDQLASRAESIRARRTL